MASTINAKNTSTGVVITPDASGQLELQTADTTRLTIDSSGNVGVGTTTANFKLTTNYTAPSSFSNASGDFIQMWQATNTNAIGIAMETTNKVARFVTNNGYVTAFNNASTEAMRIDSSGNVLVGTTTTGITGAGIKFQPGGAQVVIATSANSTNATDTYNMYSTGASAYRFYVGWGGTIHATSTTISAISDQRFKENIQDLDIGLDAVMALKPRKFDWKQGKGKDIKNDRGFIAQEFEQVFPDLIDEWKDPAPEGEEPYKSVRQDLIPVLVKAIQELKAELDTVKAELAELKGAA